MGRLKWIFELVRNILLWPLVVVFPRNQRKMLFGAWTGRNFSCNPKYFLLYILQHHPDVYCVWVGKEEIRALVEKIHGVKFVRKGSLKAFWHYLTAKFFVCNINWRGDIINLPIFKKVTVINLFHGIPYKKIGNQQYFYASQVGPTRSKFRQVLHNWLETFGNYQYPQESWVSVSSEFIAKTFCESFPRRYTRARMVVAGLPRNDFLVLNVNNQKLKFELKQRLAKQFGLAVDKRWYIYLPTFRYETNQVYSFLATKNESKIAHILSEQGAIIIEKQHPRVLERLHVPSEQSCCVFGLSEYQGEQIDLQELLLVSDRLITDYSSCFFDFALLKRPVIHFAYDFDRYCTHDTGVLYDLQEVCAGPICKTEDELFATISNSDDELLGKRGGILNDIIAGETGHASETLWSMLPK